MTRILINKKQYNGFYLMLAIEDYLLYLKVSLAVMLIVQIKEVC